MSISVTDKENAVSSVTRLAQRVTKRQVPANICPNKGVLDQGQDIFDKDGLFLEIIACFGHKPAPQVGELPRSRYGIGTICQHLLINADVLYHTPDMDTTQTLSQRALSIARQRGIARAQDFRAAGIPPAYLTRLCQRGKLQRLARGLYQLADPELMEAGHSLAEAARLAPHGVVSLLSALQHHELTTQLPHAVWVTFHHKARAPATFPFKVEVVRASGEAFTAGRTDVAIEGVRVPIYDAAKTIVDCFKYRSRVGLDVAIEALRDGIRRRKATHADIMRYAKICRVQNVMRPYLEMLG